MGSWNRYDPRRKDSGSDLALRITVRSHEVRMRFFFLNGHPSIPANIPSYQMYLAMTFEAIGWWGAVAKMLESGEEREATMTIYEPINLSA